MLAYLALILGAVLVVAGVAAIYWPAALIIAGLGVIAGALLIDTDRREKGRGSA